MAKSPPSEPVLPPRWTQSDRFVPRRFVQPVLGFMRYEAAGGIIMLVAAVLAVVWANSPLGDSYFDIFGTQIEIAFGDFHFHHLSELTVQEWINDAAMVIFFFVVGLEIKRELVVGELREPKAAALPAIAAVGGMVIPALVYVFFNSGTDASGGWGIPMATDIAFAVGVVSLVGSRVPIGAKLFLLALAIVDDLGAILVIAIFYTDELAFAWLIAAGVGLLVVYAMQRAGIRSLMAYVAVGTFVWLAVLESGVHATIAGVALALLTPVKAYFDPRRFANRAEGLVQRIDEYLPEEDPSTADHHTLERVGVLLTDLEHLSRETLSPLDRLEQALAPWSAYVVVPLFALANAGVVIEFSRLGELLTEDVTLGVALGLLVGKTVGVTAFAWVAIRLGIGRMPPKTSWYDMIGMAMLAAIGFTVALFVSALSFDDGSAAADESKIGIFAASLVAGIVGFVWLRMFGGSKVDDDDQPVLDDAPATAHP